jgi:uncharacterized protein YdhG (YjbR/CyaY superfamily)
VAKPKTIAGYIAAAPREGQAHLRRIHAILEQVAPKAQQTIKWGAPFFVDPRFLFSFSATKAHANFAPSATTLEHFREELAGQRTTKHYLQLPYDQPLPEALIRKLAKHQLKLVSARKDDSFW